MQKILISLISDQTIPNILAIHYFKPDELLFITTNGMEKKGKVKAIIDTLKKLSLNYEDKSNKLIVLEDSMFDCHRKIDKWIEGKKNLEFAVNLTGGTKIMSISAYEYFKDYTSEMIYIPIPKNEFLVPFSMKSHDKATKLELRLTVIQYLTAYGLDVINESKLKGYQEETKKRKILSKWIVKNYKNLKNLLVCLIKYLREYRDCKYYQLNCPFEGPTEEELNFLKEAKINYNGNLSKKLTRSEIRYLTGGWLEEFCFNEVSELIKKGIDDAVMGIELGDKEGTTNEFDVMFTKDNALYFVECKSLDQLKDKGREILYKIGALQKNFGLKVESFFVSTSLNILKDEKIKPSLQSRADQFKTAIIHPYEINNFKKFLSKQLKLKEDLLN